MDVVTGSFGFIGKYITRALIDSGRRVRTITTHTNKPNPFGDDVEAFPYDFSDPDQLTAHLEGCEHLYNTYWVRFNYGGCSFEQALANTQTLFACAKWAGVRKIIHVSVTNPRLNDPLPYYAGKARQEELLKGCGVPWCIIRPTLVFGKEDILVNNMAWLIRSFPVMPVFGRGDYQVQPVAVEDLASIAVRSAGTRVGATIDAIGPETFTYEELVRLIAMKIGRSPVFLKTPPGLAIFLGRLIGLVLRDIMLTRDELRGLMANKLTSEQKPNGATPLSQWLAENRDVVGRKYTSELGRHFRWRV